MTYSYYKKLACSSLIILTTFNLAFSSPLDRPGTAEDLEPERVYSLLNCIQK
jgi:hypothetical protein